MTQSGASSVYVEFVGVAKYMSKTVSYLALSYRNEGIVVQEANKYIGIDELVDSNSTYFLVQARMGDRK